MFNEDIFFSFLFTKIFKISKQPIRRLDFRVTPASRFFKSQLQRCVSDQCFCSLPDQACVALPLPKGFGNPFLPLLDLPQNTLPLVDQLSPFGQRDSDSQPQRLGKKAANLHCLKLPSFSSSMRLPEECTSVWRCISAVHTPYTILSRRAQSPQDSEVSTL